jgi:hypothetical protein
MRNPCAGRAAPREFCACRTRAGPAPTSAAPRRELTGYPCASAGRAGRCPGAPLSHHGPASRRRERRPAAARLREQQGRLRNGSGTLSAARDGARRRIAGTLEVTRRAAATQGAGAGAAHVAGRSVLAGNTATLADRDRAGRLGASHAATLTRRQVAGAAILALGAARTGAAAGAVVAVEALEGATPTAGVAAGARVAGPGALRPRLTCARRATAVTARSGTRGGRAAVGTTTETSQEYQGQQNSLHRAPLFVVRD